MFRLPLTDRTTALLRRLEEMALELVDQRGTSRTALARELGVAGNTLTANLDPDRPPEETTDPRWAFAVFEHFGRDPIQVLAGLCPADAPEELLSILPVPGLDPAEERRKRRTKAHKERVACLQAARRLDAWLPRESDEALARPWPERRFRDPDLEPVYRELEELEERRHRDAVAVEETCRQALIRPLPDEPTLPEAIRRVGLLGIWGTVQRALGNVSLARDAISSTIRLARQFDDASLLANQLQRSGYVFRELNAADVGNAVFRKASELYRMDGNELGSIYTLIDRAVNAGNQNRLVLAEKLYRAGLSLLPEEASTTYRWMAAQGIAVCLELRADLEGALKFLNATLAETEIHDPKFNASVLLCTANVARRLGEYSVAESKYWEALQHFRDYNDPDSELKVYSDLAVCLLQSGNCERLPLVREAAKRLIPKLRNRQAVQAQVEMLVNELSNTRPSVQQLQTIAAGKRRGG